MSERARKALRWAAGVGSIVLVLLSGRLDGWRQAPSAVSFSVRGTAQAQTAVASLRYRVVAERSEARYRVREQLAGLRFPKDALGATQAIEGGIAWDAQGSVLAEESRFTVDLRTLRSDERERDRYIQRNTLATDRYPAVVFVPSELRGLRVPPPASGTAAFELVGDLTLKEATRRVTWEGSATFDGSEVSVRATTVFHFGDFGLRIPRVAVVLSVEDQIRLETDLLLRRDL